MKCVLLFVDTEEFVRDLEAALGQERTSLQRPVYRVDRVKIQP